MTNLGSREVANQFLDDPSEDSFSELFQIFTPQVVAFFRKRSHEAAEDLAQEVCSRSIKRRGRSEIGSCFAPGYSG